MPDKAEKSLAQKLADAIALLRDWEPDKRNSEQNYRYISADQVISRVGGAMSKVGIAVIPEIVTATITPVDRPNKSPRLDASVVFKMTITDGVTSIDCAWPGFGTDYMTPDKAVYKAITSGHKYFLMKLFCIGVGNEDGEHEEQEQPEPPRQVVNRPQPQDQPLMTLAQAEAMANSEGASYKDLDSTKLMYIANNKKAPDDKRMAASLILKSRAEVQPA